MKIAAFFKSIHFKMITIFMLLIVIALQVIGVYFTGELESQLEENHKDMIIERADLLEYNVRQELTRDRDEEEEPLEDDIADLLQEFFSIDNSEAQVIGPNQQVLGTSDWNEQDIVGQQSTSVRVERALLGSSDDKIVKDRTGNRMLVVTQSIEDNGDILGAIYIEASMGSIYSEMNEINSIFFKGALIALAITAVIGILLSQTITKPIVDMRKQAKVMREGDFSRRVRVYGQDEIGQLAESFNSLTMNLKEANAMTEGERKKLSSVLTHMTDGVIATDELGRIILMNKRAEQLLNVQSNQIMGASLPEMLDLSETVAPSDLYDYSDSILLDFSDEHKAFLLEANFSVIRNEEGPVNGLITVLHDVTEKETIERERREFVANVSHELRTPLTTMRSYLEALEDGAMEDENLGPRFLQVTQNETERMIRLVNDLLQLSKMDSDDLKITFETVDLGALLHQISERFEMITKDKNIRFSKDIPIHPIYVDMDKDKMMQVFDNIVSNGVKYSPDGGTITIQVITRAKAIDIEISDEGVGIPKDSQPKVFDRFYRVDKARARNLGGTGLGLSIAKELVESHDGYISIDSEWQKGTTVSVTLPYSVHEKAGVSE
ncbi:two-component system sensor histidine kinase VicK [Salibacterium salarium]|uniref:cell wall metabolism sensor histidine kinase WalK n=1 Tax=Salibacterium salarium TaxID=284579 RepID=UPI002783BE81|nr:cell wall metabolism sensor histidine kinase WalK [Salibacterium salarium]MDQ0297653.1 two-component system sensor histidine kinase VicK [Salibacterium salarium]